MNKVEKAVLFATKAHAGTCRKGTDRPYILHPLEAMSIVKKYTFDEDVLSAAVLHDTVEDTSVTIAQLEREFGPRVAALVSSVSEDKRENLPAEATWIDRKRESILHLKEASRETKLICLGDKYSNLRDMYDDYADIGDALWERFNQKDKRMHAWYYREIYKILEEEFEYATEIMEFEGMMDFVFENCRKYPCVELPEEWFAE
jgi:myo-inositol-1(or 4)-monophosphatase